METGTSQEHVVQLRNVHKQYGSGDSAVAALRDVTIGFARGTFTAVMGPSESGKSTLPQPAFFAYTYPEPAGCREAAIQPDAAYYHLELSEFILPYEEVRSAASPDRMILDFFQSSYEVGATLGGWDRAALERVPSFARGGQTGAA
jgi:ATPase subunit of ABC transporter with duplicated ATPase domains